MVTDLLDDDVTEIDEVLLRVALYDFETDDDGETVLESERVWLDDPE